MEELFVRPWARARMHDGPLGTHIDAFIGRLANQGYAKATLRRAAWLLGDFSRWLTGRGLAADGITREGIEAFLRHRKRRRTPRYEDRPTLLRLLTHLGDSGIVVLTAPAPLPSPAQRLATEYVDYLRWERNLAPSTIHTHRQDAKRLLAALFGEGEVDVARMTAQEVVAHVLQVTQACGPATAKRVAGGLRAFLRFAYHRGLIGTDLSQSIPAPAHWSLSSIPRALDADHVRGILAHCDRTTANGRRDYAIILLLARLGLRAGEVAALRLEDIDWRAGELRIRNGETRIDRLPMPPDVGEALAMYLREARPPCPSRHVFVRAQAPRQGFASGTAIAGIVRRALGRAGLNPPSQGAHALRHALATQLLRDGASLAEIGEVLRHRRQRTTLIYAKVDLAALRPLATPWPGGGQ